MKTRQQLLIETHTLRQQAAQLAAALEQSQRDLDAHLAAEQRQDFMKAVAGRSALERALADTRRMLETLDRALEEARSLPSDDQRTDESSGVDLSPVVSPVIARIGVSVVPSAPRGRAAAH